LGTPEWNHYFIRAIDGEVRLWVNGHEVSGGSDCKPATGHLCLEAEGAPVEFRRLKIRPLDAAAGKAAATTSSTTTAPSVAPSADQGYTQLFDGKTLTGWQGDVAGYEVVDGELRCRKGAGGKLLTAEEYGDFDLRFDFRLTPGANNGLGIRAPRDGDAAFVGMELQILDDAHPKYASLQPWQSHGSIYGVVAAERGGLKPAGEWNSEEVLVRGSTVKVGLNGKTIVDADVAAFRDGKPTPDGKQHPGLSRTKGHIGFLGHGDEVHFRNIRIRPVN
ncbi:MAG: family 16 glycoside hydrolase, partial [Planctomycetia bacterium]